MAIKNSDALERLLTHAGKLGSYQNGVTCDRYIVAVIDAIEGDIDFGLTATEIAQLKEILESAIPDFDSQKSSLRSAFMAHIEQSSNPLSVDPLTFQKTVFNTKNSMSGGEILTPANLMQALINNPSGLLQTMMDSSSRGTDAKPDLNKIIAETQGRISSTAQKAQQRQQSQQAQQNEQKSAPEKTVDPKDFLEATTADVKNLYNKLRQRVFGQDPAIYQFITGLFRARIQKRTDPKNADKRPLATFLFAGPPGVGKTKLAEAISDLMVGMPFKRFDMSEYSNHEAATEFIGSDSVYVNSKGGNFTDYIAKNPNGIILLDEIEKAHISIIHLFLQILDGGTIRDSHSDKELSLKDIILIFTTNAGKQLYEDNQSTNLSGLPKKVVIKALEKDTNPITKEPYFPAAICSRFASGNVVMFNHLTAPILRTIAKAVIINNINGYKKEYDVNIALDDDAYTALLFSEGGNIDGRSIASGAQSFLFNELFELFRLLTSENSETKISNLKDVKIKINLDNADEEITNYFYDSTSRNIMMFTSEEIAEKCRQNSGGHSIICACDVKSAEDILRDKPVSFAVIDIKQGMNGDRKYLNIEDESSQARDFLHTCLEEYSEIPCYILLTDQYSLTEEEMISFVTAGAKGFIDIREGAQRLETQLSVISEELHQIDSINKLASSNKIINYQTSQTVSEDGSTALIELFDFETGVAVDAEDKENIMSSISRPDTVFDDVIGAEDAKKELKFFVDYLKNPRQFMGTGAKAPKGVLLYGPPGTGKTLLAKALANASDVTFISTAGNQFVSKWVGEGKDRLLKIFATARKYAPSIIFIDEIDTIAHKRGSNAGEGSTSEEATLTALLAEMDGFKDNTGKPVFVLGATNYNVDADGGLDGAVLRRFDRRIYVDLPNRDERMKFLLKRTGKNKAFAVSEEKLKNISVRSTGMSLAQLDSVLELALRSAIRDGNLKVTDAIFDEAFESFNNGEQKKWNDDLLMRVARHESGHALMYWLGGEIPSYLTVVGREGMGGYMQKDDNEDKMLSTREEMKNSIRTSLGGRAAEIVYYGDEDGISTGASSDLAHATAYAKHMICSYGMSSTLGLAYIDPREMAASAMAPQYYAEINELLRTELESAVELIRKNKKAIDVLVDRLMTENHLSGDQVNAILTEYAVK